MSRHSLRNVLRLVRGARNAAGRTLPRYARADVLELLVRRTTKALNAAEKDLITAINMAERYRRKQFNPKEEAHG